MASTNKTEKVVYIQEDQGNFIINKHNVIDIHFEKTVVTEDTKSIPDKLSAQIQITTFDQIEKHPLYKDTSTEVVLLTYQHTWVLRFRAQQLIAFNPELKEALIFDCDAKDVVQSFTMLFQLLSSSGLEIIREWQFDKFLQDHAGASIQDLKKLYSIKPASLDLLFKNQEGLLKLLDNKITMQEIFELEFGNLHNMLLLADSMQEILKFISMKQLLGKCHYPPEWMPTNRFDASLNKANTQEAGVSSLQLPIDINGICFDYNEQGKIDCCIYGYQQILVPNMTVKKLEVLAKHKAEFSKLCIKGLSVEEISNLPLARLASVLGNFETIEKATKLLDIKEVVGLKAYQQDSKFSFMFYKTGSTSSPVDTGRNLNDVPLSKL